MQKQAKLIHTLYSDAVKADKALDRDIEKIKQAKFTAEEQLHALRDTQRLTLAEITGAQAQGKSLKAKLNQLDEELLRQQRILYSMEFAVAQMETKVDRAQGERSEDEKRVLLAQREALQRTLNELTVQHKTVETQVKRVHE
uniref:Coiled-coil domain-containing protein 39 n=1 Tax=Lygus hesperus TaxID=30085 RepID=A0A0A9YMP1_LYGHE